MKKLLSFISSKSSVEIIDGLTAVLVVFIALAGLGLSLVNLANLAGANEFVGFEKWLWAGQVDFFIVVSTLAVLRAHLTGAKSAYAWTLVGITTVASVLFNAFHQVESVWLAVVMRGLPPVTLFLSFHLLMGFVGEWVKKWTLVQTYEDLLGQVSSLRDTLADLYGQAKDVQDKITVKGVELSDIKREIRTHKKELSGLVTEAEDKQGQESERQALAWDSVDMRRTLVLSLSQAGKEPADIAEMVVPSVSAKTIRRDMVALNGQLEKVN